MRADLGAFNLGGILPNTGFLLRSDLYFTWEEDLADIWVMDVVED